MENELMEQDERHLGRATDSIMGHLSLGEVVIPRAFLDDPQVMEMLNALFAQHGEQLAEFTVGDPSNKINPETGNPEFFKLKKLFKIAAPAALSYFAPGLGTALGSSILGAGAAGASTLGNALIGGGLGALGGGGLKGALTGAAIGGIGANIGSLADAPLKEGVQGPVREGSGILGSLGKATGLTNQSIPSLGGLTGSGGGSSSFSPLGAAANIYGGNEQEKAIKKQQEALLGANRSQLANLESFDPSGITSDPGYQFNLEQGQKGLTAGLNAGGSLYSGKALKAASQYNQDYASNAFNDYYQRWLTKVNGQNNLLGAGGDVRANAIGARSQNLAQSLSNIIGAPVGGYGQNMELLKKLGMAV